MESIEKLISRLETEFEELPEGRLKPDSNFSEYMAWNSMNSLLIIAFIRMEYDLEVKGSELQSVETPNDLYKLLQSKS